jgi:predicted NUDIX family NTP pyrophosphohydrolase
LSASVRPHSAGALIYRCTGEAVEVLLVHPGGPFWRSRNRGWWQIPKGMVDPGEADEMAARREAEEELGIALKGRLEPLGAIRQAGGKWVEAFATAQDIDPGQIASNTFTIEWPRGSGRQQAFPEIDEARWFSLAEAGDWMLPSQHPLLERLADLLRNPPRG